jgi:hypothetical protein
MSSSASRQCCFSTKGAVPGAGPGYCIDFAGLDDPAIRAKIVQATLTTQGGADPGEITARVNGCGGLDVTGDVYVHVTNSAGDPAPQEFDVLIVTP